VRPCVTIVTAYPAGEEVDFLITAPLLLDIAGTQLAAACWVCKTTPLTCIWRHCRLSLYCKHMATVPHFDTPCMFDTTCISRPVFYATGSKKILRVPPSLICSYSVMCKQKQHKKLTEDKT
jgi:hypothetical protein